jgi:deoxyribonucleoside regulator
MVHCAQLYYDQTEELSQAEVAGRLGINPTKVSRLLRQAQAEGIVKVAIDPPRLQRLELELMDTFGLKDAVVVPSGEGRTHDAVGKAAAEYFVRIAQDDVSIGLSPGFSIQRMIEYLEPLSFVDHRLYPLSAESTAQLRHFYPTQLAALMMTKYKDDTRVKAYACRIPNRPDHPRELPRYRAFLSSVVKDPAFKKLLDEARSADIILTGIGAVDQPDPALAAYLEDYDLTSENCRAKGAVGMINYHLFDAEGRILTSQDFPELEQMESSMVRVDLQDFRQAAKSFGRSVIALAGATYKVEAVRAALKGRFFNVLITDINVAEGLLAPAVVSR